MEEWKAANTNQAFKDQGRKEGKRSRELQTSKAMPKRCKLIKSIIKNRIGGVCINVEIEIINIALAEGSNLSKMHL